MDRKRPASVVAARPIHRQHRVRWRVALLALCLQPWGASFGAGTDAGRIGLRDARVVPVPVKVGAGRFRLAAHLDLAPAPRTRAAAVDGTLRLQASLQSKAAFALCPSPGTIFADGFEAP